MKLPLSSFTVDRRQLSVFTLAVWCALIPTSARPADGIAADAGAAARMGRYNVVWTNASRDASGVMPIGNGDIAAGGYAIENGDL